MVNSSKGDFPDAWLTPAMVPLDKMEHFVEGGFWPIAVSVPLLLKPLPPRFLNLFVKKFYC